METEASSTADKHRETTHQDSAKAYIDNLFADFAKDVILHKTGPSLATVAEKQPTLEPLNDKNRTSEIK